MPISYSIDPQSGWMLTRTDGLVTFHEVNAHLDVEQRHRDLHPAELIDARGATTDLSVTEVRRLVQRAGEMLRGVDLGPTATVTTNDVMFGMARMYGMLAEGVGVNTEAFRDMQSATSWLCRFEAQDK
jgi:hypothetical protein